MNNQFLKNRSYINKKDLKTKVAEQKNKGSKICPRKISNLTLYIKLGMVKDYCSEVQIMYKIMDNKFNVKYKKLIKSQLPAFLCIDNKDYKNRLTLFFVALSVCP